MRKKKLLFFTDHPAPYWDYLFFSLDKNYDLTVFYNFDKSVEKGWKHYKGFDGFLFKYYNIIRLIKCIKQSDHIVLGGIYFKRYLLVLYLAFFFKNTVSLFSDVPIPKFRSKFKIFLKKYFIYKYFKFFFISGKLGLDFYNKTYQVSYSKLYYLPYGWINSFKNLKTNPFNKNTFSIFISNRFIERKGYKILFDAFVLLNKEGYLKYFDINIAGNGPEKIFFENLSISKSSNVKFLGWIELDDYIEYMKISDIYIHPSLFEPFGLPVIDAMNSGKITIVSDGVMSGIDFIEHGVNGFIYKGNQSNFLKEILINIALNKYDLTSISKKAKSTIPDYSHFVEKFSGMI